jgi:hypothetical protein
MAAKSAKKARKSSLSAAGKVMASEKSDLRAERTQGTLPHLTNKDAKRFGAANSLSDLLGGQGWGQNIANANFPPVRYKGHCGCWTRLRNTERRHPGRCWLSTRPLIPRPASKFPPITRGCSCDDEEGEWRVVVDLESPKSKIPGTRRLWRLR